MDGKKSFVWPRGEGGRAVRTAYEIATLVRLRSTGQSSASSSGSSSKQSVAGIVTWDHRHDECAAEEVVADEDTRHVAEGLHTKPRMMRSFHEGLF